MLKSFLCLFLVACLQLSAHAEALRVYIRAGAKTHGPGQHDHPRFLQEWTKLLNDRGAKTSGGMDWPAPAEFANLDVIIVFAPDPWDVSPELKAAIDEFAKRGGSFVVLHDGVCSHKDPYWVRTLLGGAWKYGTAKWFEGDLNFYYVNNTDPIVQGASNFDINDELYYNLDLEPEIKVLAATWTPDERANRNGRAFPHIYDVAPQIWTHENGKSRAFVDLLGHNYTTFEQPHVRAILLRGLAWAGHREKLDEFCSPVELGSIRYPAGGPSRPDITLSKLEPAPDFRISLVAAEPLINKPIAINWDPRGRMWLAETIEYPNGRRGIRPNFAGTEWKDHGGIVPIAGQQERPAHDRISYLVDTNGDGIPDQKDIFYEGLELVTGFVFHRDGVIACAAPDIFFLRDTNGDGHADKVEKLYTGLGTRDTHAVINNLRWGFDGWIYATHGYSQSDHVTNGDGSVDFGKIGSGVVRFKPDGTAFEQYSSKGGNTWGLTITAENEVMWTQPTSGDLVMQTILPESVLALGKIGDTTSYKVVTKSPKSYPLMTSEQMAYRQIDYVGSFTAAAGCAIYDGGSWPAKYTGNYFCTEPTINIVHHEILNREGVSFAGVKAPGREEAEFIGSRDLWFRPIEVRTGPDGALYVLDFYNQAVIHNDTRGPVHNNVNAAVRPDRDHYFGRVWRVDHKEAQKLSVPDLTKASGAELVHALEHPNLPVRATAQRLLVERGKDAETVKLLTELLNGNPGPHARIHALWALQNTGALTAEALAAALKGKNADGVRNALQIAAANPALAKAVKSEMPRLLQWEDDRVRLAAILALGACELDAESMRALAAIVPSLTDHYLASAALGVAARAPIEFLGAALQQPPKGDPATAWIAFLEQIGRYDYNPPSGSNRVRGSAPAQVSDIPEKIVLLLSDEKNSAAGAAAVLRGLSEDPKGHKLRAWTPEIQAALHKILQRRTVGAAAVPLVIAWDTQGTLQADAKAVVANLRERLAAPNLGAPERMRLIAVLGGAWKLDPAILSTIAGVLGTDAPAEVQKAALQELGVTGEAEAGQLLVQAYPKLPPALQPEGFAQILKRREWVAVFVAALERGGIPLTTLGPLAMDKLRHYPDAATAALATKALDALRGPVTQQKDQLIAGLLPKVETGGDAAKGHTLFTGTCAVCHRLNNEGAALAPELTGMGAHPRAELLTHILDPNREVDPSFIAYDFVMKNGERFQGIVASENQRALVVRDAAGEHTLRKTDLQERRDIGRSLMPEGFEALGPENLRDLLAYIQSGDSRFRVLDLRKVYDADSRGGLFQKTENTNETLKFKKFGNVRVGEIPFFIADPAQQPTGKNVIVLRGGNGLAKTYPKRIEINVGSLEADVLNILGGIGGWAWPCCGDEKSPELPVAKLTIVFDDNTTEEHVFRNGVEFADYIRPHDVPGSKSAAELVNGQQVRLIRTKLEKSAIIKQLVLESFDTRVAPAFVAITAEKAAAKAASAVR